MTMGAVTATSALSQRKVFVGGLSWETDEQSLRDYFAQFGSVSDCVIMRDRLTGHPRGFGFVTYDDQSVAERVAAEFHELDGRQVEAKIAVPRSECIPPVRATAIRPTKKVFVGGLPATCRDAELRNHFAQFGDIAECQVMYDHQTGNSRGFGFVTFMSEATVDHVVDMDVHEILTKQVEVKRAEPKQALEARRGREAAAAAAALTHSLIAQPQQQQQAQHQPSPSSISSSIAAATAAPSAFSSASAAAAAAAVAAAAAAVASSPKCNQPTLSSAPSLSFPPHHNLHSPSVPPFASWTSLFSGNLGASSALPFATPESDLQQIQQQQQQQQQQHSSSSRSSFSCASAAAVAAAAAAAAAVSQSPHPSTPGGTGFFAPGHPYAGDLAQCAYAAFYAPSAPRDVFSHDLPGGISSARFDRRFHPYSSRERVERSYR